MLSLTAFSQAYRDARLREGWQPIPPADALALPYACPPGYPPLYWKVRRQSYEAFVCHLAEEGFFPKDGPIADLGAGTGWLSYRLAAYGYRVVAVEASIDQDFGLGAIEVYRAATVGRLLPVQGDLETPPLRQGRLSLILFNASLHYAQNLQETLHRSVNALRQDGYLFLLDTPIARSPRRGTGKGDRHLGHYELMRTMEMVGLDVRWVTVPRCARWRAHQARAWLRGDSRFSFPIVIGRRGGYE
jgi:SAM-dependent methyltransferase